MSVSGFKDQFLFYGFLPKKENELKKVLELLSEKIFSLIFFIPAIKINFYIKNFKNYFADRKILIGREITKLHEVFYREDINTLNLFKTPIKGELTVVISEKNTKNKTIDKKIVIEKAKKFLKKYSLKDTVSLILETERLNKKEIYKLCLMVKNEKKN